MFSSISHELRTPINAIQNSLQCVRPYVTDKGQAFIKICESSSSFLLSLVNDTLDYAMLQAGKFKVNFDEFCVPNLVNEVISLIDVQISLKKSVTLENHYDAEAS